jgi:hypothetical protein
MGNFWQFLAIAKNCQKLPEIARNCPFAKIAQLPKNAQWATSGKFWQLPNIAKYCQTLPNRIANMMPSSHAKK